MTGSEPVTPENVALSADDRDYLVATLRRLAQIPTHVPLGHETLIEPDHPKLVHYVQDVLRTALLDLGYDDLLDPGLNNLVVRTGKRAATSVLIQNYTPAQHANLMENPFSGHVADVQVGDQLRPAIHGQGVSQAKVHQAAMLTALRWLARNSQTPEGTLYWAINNEGRSSHDCSRVILRALRNLPEMCILQLPTNFDITLGNRGRVDIHVTVRGKAVHSSVPATGLNPIEGAAVVIGRLAGLSWEDSHPDLGSRHAVVYQLRFEPLAPHTIPETGHLIVDRRLLPGDSVEGATEEVRRAVGEVPPFGVEVEPGVAMLPAVVAPDSVVVRSLAEAHRRVGGSDPKLVYFEGSFDAGYPISLGIPTVMYGAGGRTSLLGTDYVTIDDAELETRSLLALILSLLG